MNHGERKGALKMSHCFIDYTKNFNTVQHLDMLKQHSKYGNTKALDSVNMRHT